MNTKYSKKLSENETFVEAYFSKVFSEELSAESQEYLTNEEKLQNLLRLYQYAKQRCFSKSLLQNLLHEILTLTIKLDEYREDLFKEYLQFPLERNAELKKANVQSINLKGEERFQRWNECLSNVQSNSIQRFNKTSSWNQIQKDMDVIPKYLEHLCLKHNGSLNDYQEHFRDSYLKQFEKKVQVYLTDSGLIDMAEDFNHQEFKKIQEEVIIKFKETNREIFKVEEAVTISLELKNVPELVIKVFEFNTETYYKKTLQPFDTSINLHGMVPSILRTERESLKDISKNKIITQEYRFDELKDKVGLFIIELQGNGKMSRAIIKKGSLSLVHQSTSAGHLAYIIDFQRQICKSDSKTGVWIEGKFFPANPSDGKIFIPYAKQREALKIIMIHQNFAQLGEFERKSEDYEFEAFYHINSESVLVGQEAQILIKPKLTINGRKTDLNLLKNSKVKLSFGDYIDETTSFKSYENLVFSNDKDTVISFQVPSNLQRITIELESQVQNITKKNLETFKDSHTIEILEHSLTPNISELYLRKIGKVYFIYALGRNGEPQIGASIDVYLRHNDQSHEASETMKTDYQGKINLGELTSIQQIRARLENDNSHCQEEWTIENHYFDVWTQSEDIHIVEGEVVEFPIFTQGKNMKLEKHQISLLMTRDGKILENLFGRIKIEKSNCSLYDLLKLEGLEAGSYVLKIQASSSKRQKIHVRVHKGTHWNDQFILKKNCLFQSSAQKHPVRIDDIKVESQNPNEMTLSIKITNLTDLSRVHVVASQFISNYTESLRDLLETATTEKINECTFPFAKWKNMYESDNVIGDEIRYVFDRQKKQNQMGNTLDRPTLLMKRNFLQTTETLEENLQAGTSYQKADMAGDIVQQSKMMKKKQMVSKRSDGPSLKCGAAYSSKMLSVSPITNNIKDYQNFLSVIPFQAFNLKPDKNGIVNLKIQDIQNYNQIFVIVCDKDSVVQRSLNIKDLIADSLNEAKLPKIPMRDLSVNKKVKNDEKIGVMECRDTSTLMKGETVHIEDITSSKFIIIDDLSKVHKVVEQMKSLNLNPHFHSPNSSQWETLIGPLFLEWVNLSFEKKVSKYSQCACHELNYFIFKKDKEFYVKVAKSFIENKLEKSFIDWYLLGMEQESSSQFSQKIFTISDSLVQFNQLNAFEKCLLVDFCLIKGDRSITEKVKSLAKMEIQKFNIKIHEEPYYKDGNTRTRIFDAILGQANQEQANLLMRDSFEAEKRGVQFHEYYAEKQSELQDIFQAESSGIQDFCLFGAAGGGGGTFGGRALNAAPPRAANVRLMHYQHIQPMMTQSIQPMMTQNIQPMARMRNQSNNIFGLESCRIPQSDSCAEDEGEQEYYAGYESISKERKRQANIVGFEQLDKTAEYMETHYYKQKAAGSCIESFVPNRFTSDYLQYLLNRNNDSIQPFLTSSFVDIATNYLPFALSLIDMPCAFKDQHKYLSDQKRGIRITVGANSIIFKKEIKEGECHLKNDVMVTQRYQSLIATSNEEEIEDMIINHPYQCEVIMTNVSQKEKEITLLSQIPNGSLPLRQTKYIDSQQFTLEPYTTIKKTIQFYFPKEGKFEHAPSNISEKFIVISKSALKILEVGRKRVIKKVETFRDLMMITPSDKEKKQKILELFESKQDLLFDKKYGFQLSDICFFAVQDSGFYLKIAKILYSSLCYYETNDGFAELLFVHINQIFRQEEYKSERKFLINQVKDLILSKSQHLSPFILKPLKSQLFDSKIEKIFDQDHKHLEYSPMVNQRVFKVGGQDDQVEENSIGGGAKTILNKQFKQTYKMHLFLAINQAIDLENNKICLIEKQKLQLAYFLQLQDRVDEAIRVFREIDLQKIQKDQDAQVAQILYDYMDSYFAFFENQDESNQFTKIREIVKKYENCPIEHFKNIYLKIKEQLNEIDAVYQAEESAIIDASQTSEITEEQKRLAKERTKKNLPLIHDIKTDSISGDLTIELENLNKITVKYYLIDAEILFSRSPFVKEEAKQFSYVKPYLTIEEILVKGQQVAKIQMPHELKSKNVVIEVNSEEIQRFLTFYSSQMKLQINEDFGELRVFHRNTAKPLSKIYVKVFCKNTNGQELFFRDGFTDIRGKFEYANASGKQLNSVARFSILVSDFQLGQIIQEVNKPKDVKE